MLWGWKHDVRHEVITPVTDEGEESQERQERMTEREGYFGIQVNSATERRILFSVWSPFSTDNPKEIPDDKKIKLLRKGKDVHTGEFGNEGSGGQSYLRYQWKTGTTSGDGSGDRSNGGGLSMLRAPGTYACLSAERRSRLLARMGGF